jgi:hypothetical protein
VIVVMKLLAESIRRQIQLDSDVNLRQCGPCDPVSWQDQSHQ